MTTPGAIRLYRDPYVAGLAYSYDQGDDIASGSAGPDYGDVDAEWDAEADYAAAVAALGDLVCDEDRSDRNDGLMGTVTVTDLAAAGRLLESLEGGGAS